MNVKATYLLATFLLLLSTVFTQQSNAQNALGIVWEAPEDTSDAKMQLLRFSDLGITHLEIEHPVSTPILNLLEKSEFEVMVRSGEYFLSISEIESHTERLTENYLQLIEQYENYSSVTGLGLLSHSHFTHSRFSTAIAPVINELTSNSNKTFYFFFNEKWFTFNDIQKPYGIFFTDQSYEPSDLYKIDSSIHSLIATNSDQIFFIRSSWFLEATDQYPELAGSLIEFKENNLWKLPLPEVKNLPSSSNWMVLILLILWAALAIQIKYLPYIRTLILRFFLAHHFYVDDILHYRERYIAPGILMMIKHAFFGGLVFFIAAQILLSEYGLEAFFHQLPFFAVTGSNYFSFFFFGLILILLTQIIALLWLHLPAKTIDHFSQTVNLYAGSFYIDYLIITLMVTLFTAGIGTSFTLILASIYIFVWFMAFNLAAFDASRMMGGSRFLYLFLTVGLHAIVSFAALLFILLNTNLVQIVDLALSL